MPPPLDTTREQTDHSTVTYEALNRRYSSSERTRENQGKSANITTINKIIKVAESKIMSTLKLIYKEMVAIFMSRIGSALVWWFIATLVVALGFTMLT